MLNRLVLPMLALFLLASCAKSDKLTLVESTGRINNLLIVLDNSDWDGPVGEELKQIIGQPVVGLPQEEDQFSVNQVDPLAFNSLFKRSRNILFVGLDTLRQFYTNQDVFASPQTTLTILGEDRTDLIDNIREHQEEILDIFKKNDLILYQKKITKDFHDPDKMETFNNLGLSLRIPLSYSRVEDNGEFLWYRNTFTRGLLNIIAYEVPLAPGAAFEVDSLVAYRDSIGKKFIPGQFDKTYMRTESNFQPVTRTVTLAGKEVIESRGLWYVEGDYMGGPFISYTLLDKDYNRLLVVEGFSYSPGAKKRDFVFELEAILKTLQLK